MTCNPQAAAFFFSWAMLLVLVMWLALRDDLRRKHPVLEEYMVQSLQVAPATNGRGASSSYNSMTYILVAECAHGHRKVTRVPAESFEVLREGMMVELPACSEFLAFKQKEAERAED